MKAEDLNSLIEKYPDLFPEHFHFECYNGWYDILDQLCDKLDKLRDPEFGIITQIKEKYGTLRVYMSCMTHEMDQLIEEAENRSVQTCEICGEPGLLRSKFRWLFTRCERHKDV